MARRKLRYRALLTRKGGPPDGDAKTVYTTSYSKRQAIRFLHKRHPGWHVAAVSPDPRQNPPGKLMGRPQRIVYRHVADGELYEHEFGLGDELRAMPDGSLQISNPTRRLWREFE